MSCAPDEVCPRGAYKEDGRCLNEQQDVVFPTLGADTLVRLADVTSTGSDTLTNTDDLNAETDTISASNADIADTDVGDGSDAPASDDTTSTMDTDEAGSEGQAPTEDTGGMDSGS